MHRTAPGVGIGPEEDRVTCDGCGGRATRKWGAIPLCAACYRVEVPPVVAAPRQPPPVAVPPAAPTTPRRVARQLDVDPSAPDGQCGIKGCTRPVRTRGLCDSCHCAARRKNRFDLMDPPEPRNVTTPKSERIRKQIIAMADEAGVTPASVRTVLSLTAPQAKEHLRRLVVAGLLKSEHGRYIVVA